MRGPHEPSLASIPDRSGLVAVSPVCLLLVLMVAGCAQPEIDEPSQKATELKLFEEGKGVRLPEEMQREQGIEIVEVVEKPITRRLERTAKVHRAADGSRTASAVALLDEADAADLRVGQAVSLGPAGGGKELTGMLARLDWSLTNVLGQGEAMIEFADADRRHPVASLLTALFVAARTNAVPAIPAAAVLRGVEGTFVYTVSGSHFVRTPIRTGAEAGEWVEIVDGLYAGDAVVAKGAEALWLIELCALKGGSPCCPVAKKPGQAGD